MNLDRWAPWVPAEGLAGSFSYTKKNRFYRVDTPNPPQVARIYSTFPVLFGVLIELPQVKKQYVLDAMNIGVGGELPALYEALAVCSPTGPLLGSMQRLSFGWLSVFHNDAGGEADWHKRKGKRLST